MGRPKGKPTTLVRAEVDIKKLAEIHLPLYSQAEIFKAGYISLLGYNKVGRIIYGKNVWERNKIKKKKK